MPILVRGVLFPAGTGGAPSTTNPQRLPALDRYEHTIVNEGGFESAQIQFRVRTRAAADAYLTLLMANVLMTGPRGTTVWEGFVQEVTIDLGRATLTRSLVDLANRIVVRSKDASGKQLSGTPVNDAASIARYGTKTRLINLSTASASAAANRAAVVLAKTAAPRPKRSLQSGSGAPPAGYAVTLVCRGWWDTLGWLLTSSTSTTMTQTSAQVLTLLIAYCATNPFFDLSAVSVVPTGVSDVETIEADSTYLEAITTKLASGTSAQQPVVYGCYEGRRLTLRPWAGATPDTIRYVQRAGSAHVVDTQGNTVDPWDVRPDAMVLTPDLGSRVVDRFYCKRVRLTLTPDSQELTLEPDEPDGVAELLTQPAGAASSGTSARQAAIERTIVRQASTRFSGSNGTVDLGGGTITPDGRITFGSGGSGGTIDTGGGAITNTGGGSIDLGNPGGTRDTLQAAPRDATYWLSTAHSELSAEQDMSTLGTGLLKQSVSGGIATPAIAVAGTDYLAPSGLNELIDDRVAALLAAGSGISLSYNDAGNVLTISNTGGTVGGSGTAGRLMQWATGGADAENSTLIKSGAGVLTLSAAAAATLTIDSTTRLDGTGAAANQVLQWNGTAYAPSTLVSTDISNWNEAVDDRVAALLIAGSGISLSYNDAGNVLTISNTGGTVGGSGTAGRIAQWATGGADLQDSTLIKSGAGVLTLAAAGSYTLTIPATGTVVLGTGTTNQVAYWAGTNTLTGDAGMTYDATNNRLTLGALHVGTATGATAGQVKTQGRIITAEYIQTNDGNPWDLGLWEAITISPTGRVSISISGVKYWIPATPA